MCVCVFHLFVVGVVFFWGGSLQGIGLRFVVGFLLVGNFGRGDNVFLLFFFSQGILIIMNILNLWDYVTCFVFPHTKHHKHHMRLHLVMNRIHA